MEHQHARLALKLARFMQRDLNAERQQERIRARYALVAAEEVAYVLGYGRSAHHVDEAVRDFMRVNPEPVDASAGQHAAKAWSAKVIAELAPKLAEIYEP
jgi:hypothetical protein